MGKPRRNQGSVEATIPLLSGPVPAGLIAPSTLSGEEKWQRKQENEKCEGIAEREGDRLLQAGDKHGAEVAHHIAAMMRIRRDNLLEPF